ncbi:MAG: hypothetical protein U0074_08600 [Kouleothrix sp.]
MRRSVAPEQVSGVAAALRDLSRALLFELKKLLVLVVGGILLLIDIPGVGQVLATTGGHCVKS